MRFTCSWLALVFVACATPTIPVGPPNIQDQALNIEPPSPAGDPQASFSALPQPEFAGARVTVLDLPFADGVATIANEDGSVTRTQPFRAAIGDRIEIEYRIENDVSVLCVLLPAAGGQLSQNDLCPMP